MNFGRLGARFGQLGSGGSSGALSWATFDANFATGVYKGCSVSDFTTSRGNPNATDLTPFDIPGRSYTGYVANTNRIRSGLGWIIEAGPKTNSYPSGSTPANQTTASLAAGTYTAWINAEANGQLALSAGTPANVSGLATVTHGVPVTFTITGAGSTISGVVSGTIYTVQIESNLWATTFINGASSRGNELCALGFLPTGMATGKGTLIASMTHFDGFGLNTNPNVLVNLDDGSANLSRVSIFRRLNAGNSIARAVIDTQPDIGPLTDLWQLNTKGAIGFAVDAGYQAECFNGGTVTLATGALPSNGVTTMRFGKGAATATADHSNGVLHRALWGPTALSGGALKTAVLAVLNG